jgi:acetyl-CoA carboxylase carboxyltransferase component
LAVSKAQTVGFVANQPMTLAGVLDIDASKQGGAVCALL